MLNGDILRSAPNPNRSRRRGCHPSRPPHTHEYALMCDVSTALTACLTGKDVNGDGDIVSYTRTSERDAYVLALRFVCKYEIGNDAPTTFGEAAPAHARTC